MKKVVLASAVVMLSASLVNAQDLEQVKKTIDGTDNRSFLETKRKLAECVDLHAQLIKLADEQNRIYGPFNLTFIVLISMKICMLGIMIMVRYVFWLLKCVARNFLEGREKFFFLAKSKNF